MLCYVKNSNLLVPSVTSSACP